MHLDLIDDEARALLNVLIEVIENSRYPMSPSIRVLQAILSTVRHPQRAAIGTGGPAASLYDTATSRSPEPQQRNPGQAPRQRHRPRR